MAYVFQTCISANRILVQSGIYDTFVAAMLDAVRGLRMGDGLDDGVTIGPLINEPQINKVNTSLKKLPFSVDPGWFPQSVIRGRFPHSHL